MIDAINCDDLCTDSEPHHWKDITKYPMNHQTKKCLKCKATYIDLQSNIIYGVKNEQQH